MACARTICRLIDMHLADYHVPVHADVHDIAVIFVDERDDIVNPLGAKGLARSALWAWRPRSPTPCTTATGRRVRDSPSRSIGCSEGERRGHGGGHAPALLASRQPAPGVIRHSVAEAAP
jgi:hypothetical protein